jgi:hypothetical protein
VDFFRRRRVDPVSARGIGQIPASLIGTVRLDAVLLATVCWRPDLPVSFSTRAHRCVRLEELLGVIDCVVVGKSLRLVSTIYR